jgi:dethiobiotin synthetase
MLGNAIFVTGTDTGVGKTYFTCALAALLRADGYQVGVMKPAETGCAVKDGQLFADAAWRLKEASGCAESIDRICPYRLPEPLAPSIAAARAGVKIDVDHLLTVCRDIGAKHDITLIEGAGGLLVPLVGSFTYADFARVARLPVIVVAANKLGVINHLLLTLKHGSCKGLPMLGYLLNHLDAESSLAAETNREVLAGMTGVPCLGEIQFAKDTKAAENILSELDLRPLELLLCKR